MLTVIAPDLNAVPSQQWNQLDHAGIPFLRHEFLAALERTACVGNDSGWLPEHLLLYESEQRNKLLGAVPMYRKYHSYGEYVFDWSWAAAYERAGLDYYPKLLVGTPFTPVTGPRLLIAHSASADSERIRQQLVAETIRHAERSGVSSLHWIFTNNDDNRILNNKQLLARCGTQFHWHNQGYTSFAEYIQAMSASKRKKIKRERRRITESALRIETVTGPAVTEEHMHVMHQFYRSTVRNHGGTPYLNAAFFQELVRGMPDNIVLFLAYDGERCVAGSFNLSGDAALFGRYWGSLGHYNALHFELCYYHPIEYCITHNISRFEAGAQGEHKLSRGLLPVPTYSWHWLQNPVFAHAVSDFLHRESHHVEAYTELLHSHSPFRHTS